MEVSKHRLMGSPGVLLTQQSQVQDERGGEPLPPHTEFSGKLLAWEQDVTVSPIHLKF